jgi:MFS family permease
MLIVQLLPMAAVGPLAGVVVDRVDRRRLMIVADVLRGCTIPGLLLVRRPDQVWIAYVVMAVTMGASAFFEPARTATIPNVTSAEELMPANAISAAGWSTMLAVGAAVGGLITAVAGRNAAFVVNSASFFLSAGFIAQTRFDSTPAPRPPLHGVAAMVGLTDLVEGFRYVRRRPHVAALMFVKAGWGLAGGVLLLLTIFGQRIFHVGGSTAAGIGVLYGARGIGAGLGAFALRGMLGQTPRRLRQTIAPAFFMIGGFYAALSVAPTLPIAALSVLLAHFGGSVIWVFSTVLLQMEVPDRFRGRVFATELALVTLTSALSAYATAYELDRMGRSPRTLSLTLGVLFCVVGAIWTGIQLCWRERSADPAPDEEAVLDEAADERGLKSAAADETAPAISTER